MQQTVLTTEPKRLDPFLKWAGGKRWLTESNLSVVPTTYNRYIEPFLGSAAIFFAASPKGGSLSDRNPRLIETYIEIRDNWKRVVSLLSHHQNNHSSEYYYIERAKKYRSSAQRAAQFIYLNRTCWNGLYRVNLKGDFNVPIGTKSSVLLKTDNFREVSKLLKPFNLGVRDFSQSIKASRDGDFVFCDPPYTVKHNHNGFVKYNESLFSWDDQVRLRNCLEKASNRGTQVSLTNADHESIREIYTDPMWKVESVSRQSVIAASSAFRTKTTELLIKNW